MERFVLTDAQWAKMEPLCRGKPSDPGRSGKDNRLFVEAVLWIARLAKTKRLHLRPLGVSQNESVHPKLESQPSKDENPESKQTLVREAAHSSRASPKVSKFD